MFQIMVFPSQFASAATKDTPATNANRARDSPLRPTSGIHLSSPLLTAKIRRETGNQFLAAGETAMPAQTHSDVTALLQDLHDGNPEAKARLLQSAYDELRRIAAGILRGERPDHSWQSTDLVHELFLRLDFQVHNRSEFFAAATRVMRELVIEHARLRKAQKRGGGWQRVPLDDVAGAFARRNVDPAAVHEALSEMAAFQPRQSQVITLRFFGGYTLEEIASMLEVSVSTVQKDQQIALAWLHRQLGDATP
jgi:RNA polymerase sigma factor (TIGR02999 family)